MNIAHDLVVMPIDKLKKYIADVYNDSLPFNDYPVGGLKTITPANINVLNRGFFLVNKTINPVDNLFFMGALTYRPFVTGSDNTIQDAFIDIMFRRYDPVEDEFLSCQHYSYTYEPFDLTSFRNNHIPFGVFNHATAIYKHNGVQTSSNPSISIYGICFELID